MDPRPRQDERLSRRMDRVTPSAIMELIKTTAGGDYISFSSGLPDPSLFPVDAVRGIAEEVLARDGRAALQYGPAEGYGPLRELVAEILRGRGLRATADHVLITNGSQQALDLAARAFLDPGDAVLIETPSYLAAIQTFDSYEARYACAPMDEDGMVLEGEMPEVSLVYTLPNFQNPTGISLAHDRRERLARAAAARSVPVIEDDAYHDLRYDGEAGLPVCALAENPRAVYTGTLSKTIAPGLRVGYLCAEPALVARLAQLKQITDLHTGSLTQRIAHRYCAEGYLEPGVRAFRESYRARRDAMLDALEAHLSSQARWTRPRGGMFIWVTLPDGRDTGELLRKVMARGVLFVPGASFHPSGGGRNTLRLTFVSATEERIREGIRILAGAIAEGPA